MYNSGISAYQQVNVQSANYADPHHLIAMLFDGALSRIVEAKRAMAQRELAAKGTAISKAMSIIGGLRGSLDAERGGELAANLDALYDYMQRQLAVANARNSAEILDEVSGLIKELKAGWDAIPAEARQAPLSTGTAG